MSSELPRPPRRVPAGADDGTPLRPRTVIEARPGSVPDKPVRPPRPWYLLPLLLAVLAAGTGVGWLARQQDSADPLIGGFDPDHVLDKMGPAVVRVHASSCQGTGLATGVVIGDGRVLTVRSALKGPIAGAVETADGRVREATVAGVDTTSGVAVLQLLGDPLDLPVPEVAASTPADTTQDVPVIGYDDNGKQQVDLHAITRTADGAQLTGVTGLLPAASAGAPVFDRQQHLIGLLTQSGASGARGIGVGALKKFAAGGGSLSFERAPDDCERAADTRAAVVPALDGPDGALAEEAQRLLGDYIAAINRHDAEAIRNVYGGRLDDRSAAFIREQFKWQTLFGPVIRSVVKDGEGAQVEMTHTALQRPDAKLNAAQPDPKLRNLRCLRYDIDYTLIRVDGKLQIDWVTAARREPFAYRPCSSD